MSDDDSVNLAEEVKKLRDRVAVLETDMLHVIASFRKLRAFVHVHPGLERHAQEYDNLVNVLRERYKIPQLQNQLNI